MHSDLTRAIMMGFQPQSYDLKIEPNATAQGLPVEANKEGLVVAVRYPEGLCIRNNFKYLICHCPTANSLIDSNQMIHPLD